ncbi:MAG TPA: hypothetical protein VEF06_00600 [Bryobacteraceae bacterium]|nr:hypothetical protein [Bryobacteraceae bacterium]
MQIRLVAALALFACGCLAQTAEEEPAAIIEVGGANSWNVAGGSSAGGDLAVEFTPIENWLEMEVGTTPVFARHTAEWDTDLLFKKPWTLSKKTEFMIGLGPEWVHTRQSGITKNALAGEFALDFMYWPGARHRFGWFVEPSYDYTFGHEHERSVSLSWGLLIAIP